MSFILDALRKSDNERREQSTPPLAAAPRAVPAQKKSIWLPIIAVVLAVNAMVFGAIFLTRDEPMPPAATTQPAAAPEVRPLRKEIPAESAPKQPAPTPTAKTSLATVVAAPEPAGAPVVVPKPVPAPTMTIQEGLPSLGQLRASGLVQVGSLRVDMHVYSDDPSKRFVFINMKKYREGDRLTEGPTIEEITPDGIILVEQGNRFRLDRD